MSCWFWRIPVGLVLLLCGALGAGPAAAVDQQDWSAAMAPGAVLIMRHALAPGTGDPDEFDVADCKTQRNLSQAGRNQARAIGSFLRAKGLRFDLVLSSAWCRCQETARLLDLGSTTVLPALNSFFQELHREEGQTADLNSYLDALPQGKRVLLVTHQVNISALTGKFTRSGEILVLQRGQGRIQVTGNILIDP